MSIQATDKELEAQMEEDLSRYLGILAHYKPGIEDTINNDFQAALLRDEVYIASDNPFHDYVFRQLAICITGEAIAMYNGKTEELFGMDKEDFEECLFDGISWFLDGLTLDFYINYERVFTLADVQKSMAGMISEWRMSDDSLKIT